MLRLITLTDEGRAVTARMQERLVTLRARLLKGVTHEDLETTLRVLHAFSATLDVKSLAEIEAIIEGETKAMKASAKST